MVDREEFEERAAIMEFDGGLDRPVAERRALLLFVRQALISDESHIDKLRR
jgi:hypothetical protein